MNGELGTVTSRGLCMSGIVKHLYTAGKRAKRDASAHKELCPDYQEAVIESFLDKVGREIDARVDARLAQQVAQPPGQRGRGQPGSPMTLAIACMALGIPISAIVVAVGAHPAGFMGYWSSGW
jgi:hypothetical protein